MSDMGDKVEADEKAKIEAAITDLKDTLKDENATKEQIEEKVKTLTEASHKVTEEMYKQQAGGEQPKGQADQAKKKDDDDVIDAEIE
jgi:molecular chaperone DnaK